MDNKFEVYESGQYCEEILIKQGRRGEEPRDPEGFDFHRTEQSNQKLFWTCHPQINTHTCFLLLFLTFFTLNLSDVTLQVIKVNIFIEILQLQLSYSGLTRLVDN